MLEGNWKTIKAETGQMVSARLGLHACVTQYNIKKRKLKAESRLKAES